MVLLGPTNYSIRDGDFDQTKRWSTDADKEYFSNSDYVGNLTTIVGTGTKVRTYDDNAWERIAITEANVPHPNYEYLSIEKEHWVNEIDGNAVNNDINFAQEVFAWLDE